MTNQGFLPFQDLTGCHKALYTMTLLILGVAYLFAMIQTFSVHASRDGNVGLSPNDLVLAYSGSTDATRLEAAIKGPMSGMLHKEDAEEIVLWIQGGAEEGRYQDKVVPIMEDHCFNCHGDNEASRAAYPHNPILQGYSNVMKMVEIDTGADILTLVRVSHIHLFGMTFIFFIVGGIFLHANVQPACMKCIILITPFIAIMLDIFSWYLTKLYPPFAWIIYLSGVFMALSFTAQWVLSMYQMWFYRLPRDNIGGGE
ncbi:MAG: hypothetical protein OEU91_03195 [Gammaproteobacteria bacterium]|nr:hypothetical protein [Gammaproteobacteria bacterium]